MSFDTSVGLSIGLHIKKVNELILCKVNNNLKKYNLTVSQIMIVMYCLQKKGDYIMQKELESFFDLTHSTVIGLLKRLSENGFVTVCVADEDKRQRKVFLTDKSYCLADELEEKINNFDQMILQHFSKEEIEAVKKYLQKIYENLQSMDLFAGNINID